jgi:hypothetical protein
MRRTDVLASPSAPVRRGWRTAPRFGPAPRRPPPDAFVRVVAQRVRERGDGRGILEPAEGLGRRRTHRRDPVVQGTPQRDDRATLLQPTQRPRGDSPDVRVGIAQALDQGIRRGDDLAQPQRDGRRGPRPAAGSVSAGAGPRRPPESSPRNEPGGDAHARVIRGQPVEQDRNRRGASLVLERPTQRARAVVRSGWGHPWPHAEVRFHRAAREPHRMRGAPRAASSTSRAHRASSDAVAATSRRGGPAVPVPALPVQHSTTIAAVRPRLPRFILSLPRFGCSPVMCA